MFKDILYCFLRHVGPTPHSSITLSCLLSLRTIFLSLIIILNTPSLHSSTPWLPHHPFLPLTLLAISLLSFLKTDHLSLCEVTAAVHCTTTTSPYSVDPYHNHGMSLSVSILFCIFLSNSLYPHCAQWHCTTITGLLLNLVVNVVSMIPRGTRFEGWYWQWWWWWINEWMFIIKRNAKGRSFSLPHSLSILCAQKHCATMVSLEILLIFPFKHV